MEYARAHTQLAHIHTDKASPRTKQPFVVNDVVGSKKEKKMQRRANTRNS